MDHQICFRLNAMLLKALFSLLDERRLMTEGEVAEIFDVDPRTVRRWRNSGYIGFYRLEGGDVRFSLDQVNRRKGEMERPSKSEARERRAQAAFENAGVDKRRGGISR